MSQMSTGIWSPWETENIRFNYMVNLFSYRKHDKISSDLSYEILYFYLRRKTIAGVNGEDYLQTQYRPQIT